MTFPNPKWFPGVTETIDNAAAVDKGGGLVGIPITGHSLEAEQIVVVDGTTNYDGSYEIISKTADEIVITATYVAETFAGTETVDFGRQVILKEDLRAIEEAITGQPTARMQPFLTYHDAHTVKLVATADCPIMTRLDGMPNILNPVTQVSGGLSDGKTRTITTNVSCDLAAGGLYGGQTEKATQWYAIFAVADDVDTDFTLTALPIMRVKSQTGQAIKMGTLLVPGTGINYAFTDDILIGGALYMLSGASKGLIRTISANDVDTDTRITYTGTALSVSAGDWCIVLPPTNFRFVGTINNNASSNIVAFLRDAQTVWYLAEVRNLYASHGNGVIEVPEAICPFANEAYHQTSDQDGAWAHPDFYSFPVAYVSGSGFWAPAVLCRIYMTGRTTDTYVLAYRYPANCGF